MAAVRIVVGESIVPLIAPMEQAPVVITVTAVQGLLGPVGSAGPAGVTGEPSAPGPPPVPLADEPGEGES